MSDIFNDFYFNVELVDENSKIPTRAHSSDAGMDFFARTKVDLAPLQRTLVPLGCKVEFPTGFVLKLEDKSGRAYKQGLQKMAGIIDSDYREEVQ